MLPTTQSRFLKIAAQTLTALLLTLPAPAQQLSRRLILKDGSYQSITKYEVHGDRVRYFSAERDDWEELPSSLVDWPATEKYEKERAAAPAIPEAALVDKETDAERAAAESHLPQVAPGLRLPDLSGMFLLDNYKGQPQLVEIEQNEGDVNSGSRADILRGAIIRGAGAKQTIELEGEHATTYAHVAVPSIYINIDNDEDTSPAAPAKPSDAAGNNSAQRPQQPQQPQQPEAAIVPFDRFHIVRLKAKNGKRIVGDIKRAPTGKITPEQNSVKTTIDRVGTGWLKLTPTEDLAPGEYAIVETKSAEGVNLYVWPFAVNPNAPANANPWKPDVKDDKKDKNSAQPKEN
ncbi:MAG: hypothetical protein WAM78_07495 [Candidatus Sulfotelmatobacter sp.]